MISDCIQGKSYLQLFRHLLKGSLAVISLLALCVVIYTGFPMVLFSLFVVVAAYCINFIVQKLIDTGIHAEYQLSLINIPEGSAINQTQLSTDEVKKAIENALYELEKGGSISPDGNIKPVSSVAAFTGYAELMNTLNVIETDVGILDTCHQLLCQGKVSIQDGSKAFSSNENYQEIKLNHDGNENNHTLILRINLDKPDLLEIRVTQQACSHSAEQEGKEQKKAVLPRKLSFVDNIQHKSNNNSNSNRNQQPISVPDQSQGQSQGYGMYH